MYKIFSLLVLCIVFTMCQKKQIVLPEPVKPEISTLVVSYDSIFTLNSLQMKTFAAAFGGQEIVEKLKYGVQAYKLNYKTSYKGNTITASGLMYVPVGMTTSAPLISVQHGTTFVKSDAPSVSKSLTGVEFFASAGYVTLMPDFIGYGASAAIDHPYYDAKHSSLSVIDMIKAAKEFFNENKTISLDSKLFLTGYSEGGYVTMATQRAIETDPNSDLKITGVTAGAGGYDLTEMLRNIGSNNYYSYPAYLAFIIHSYNTIYDWGKSNNYFYKQPFAQRLDTLLNGNTEGNYINRYLTTNMDSLLNTDFYQGLKGNGETQFRNALISNSPTDWKPAAPIRLYHGTRDADIPFENSVSTYNKLKNEGANISLISISDGTHGSSLSPMIQYTFSWFETLR